MNEFEAPPPVENAVPTSDRVQVEFQIHLAQPSRRLLVRDGVAPPKPERHGRLPRVARMLIQAHLFQRMLDSGQVADLADLARRFKLTRARVTQIANYTLLAPDLQAEILAMPLVEPGHEPIREPAMRAVLREVLWSAQRERWRVLVRRQGAPTVAEPASASTG